MDETVDSFLKEINKIVPPQSIWEECYDEKSGFTYYWNTKTDEVTWDVPEDYKKQNSKTQNKKKLYIPPPSEEKIRLGSIPHVNQADVKIYKIDDLTTTAPTKKENKTKISNKKKQSFRKPSSESEDEKIVLISSYGSDSTSDDEINVQQRIGNSSEQSLVPPPQDSCRTREPEHEGKKTPTPYTSEDETDILNQLQTKAIMLKQMGGELPESVKRLVSDNKDDKGKDVHGAFSLVAGYGNDSEEESEQEELPKKAIFPIKQTIPVSTLFPLSNIPSPPQSHEKELAEKPDTPPQEAVDIKAFQRKRRIGVSLVNVQKKPHIEQESKPADSARPGFGFKGGPPAKEYPGFKSAGVMIWSAPEEIPTPTVENETNFTETSDEELIKGIEDFHSTLAEKLKFLCEGHSPALPVQLMIIQLDTLYTAMQEKCLKPSYLQKWLDNTCQDLSKLEKEAAPAGWLLQWDRTHKRYYYRNETTNENQWEYPQPDIVSVDEAMDISTTPPPPVINDESQPAESMNLVLPPPPPQIKEKSISPPPPPVISDFQLKENVANEEPYPPGVDEPELERDKEFTTSQPTKDAFTSELNSFYSDIATMESSQPATSETPPSDKATTVTESVPQAESVPGKKKKKIKISQGLAMKKKGVSKLVEKWKNVQKTY